MRSLQRCGRNRQEHRKRALERVTGVSTWYPQTRFLSLNYRLVGDPEGIQLKLSSGQIVQRQILSLHESFFMAASASFCIQFCPTYSTFGRANLWELHLGCALWLRAAETYTGWVGDESVSAIFFFCVGRVAAGNWATCKC